MIISASRRTDIPAFYSEWFLRRLAEGQFLVPHPRTPNRLGQVKVSPDNLDCIMFWTKNAGPMLDRLKDIDHMGYRYYFSFTVTAYGQEVEKNLPPKGEIVDTFRKLADLLGPERVDWRFDPIMVDSLHSSDWHLEMFGRLCRKFSGYTNRCLMNFVKSYRHLGSKVREMDDAAVQELALGLVKVAAEHGLPISNCTERLNLEAEGLNFSACIDRQKIENLIGGPIKAKKDPGQPSICRCLESVDIGVYDSCVHGCLYCYAVTNQNRARRRLAAHDANAPMLTGYPDGSEIISDRTRPTLKDSQSKLF
ncbi:hypothetical protein C4J81_15830 [Deltaproteobacteria bacterium Smac51]|nr:hypothetical protein C4J81_15830 [Deltaproteobacteria bacterium Smac51]